MAFPSIDMFIVALLDLVASGAFLTFVCMEFPKFMILESVVVFILSLLCFIGIFVSDFYHFPYFSNYLIYL